MATAIHPVKIPIVAIDNASKVISRITKGLSQSLNKGFKFPKMPEIPNFGKRIQSQINNISFGRVLSTVTSGISAIKNKLSTLSIGNAPNLMEKSFKRAFKNIRGEVSKLQAAIEKAANVQLATQGMKDFGQKTLSTLASPIQAGMAFEAQMSKVSAVALTAVRESEGLEAANKQLAELTANAQKLGSSTAWSATQIAEGQMFLGMTGMKAADIMTSMAGLADLASAGAIELGQAADIASNIGSALFGQDAASQMQRMADGMAATITSYNVDVSMLGETMKYAAPIAKTTGISFEQLAVATGIL